MKIVQRSPVQSHRAPRPSATRGSFPAPYFTLSCGHSTTIEVQLAYSAWRTSQHKYYCEECNKWLEQVKKPKPPPLPEEPMF